MIFILYYNSKKIENLEEIVIIEKDNYIYNNIYEIV